MRPFREFNFRYQFGLDPVGAAQGVDRAMKRVFVRFEFA